MENKKFKKRVLIATGIYPPSIGGPATYSKMLFDELPHYNIEAKVVSFDTVRRWPKGIRHIIYFFKLYNQAKDFDIIYAQDPVSVGLPALIASHFSGKPLLLKVVGDYAWEQACQRYGVTDLLDVFVTKNTYPFGVRVLRWIERKVAKSAYGIVVPSEYLKSIVSKWGISREKIIMIPNALEGEMPQQGKEILRAELNITKFTIISAGRLVPWKGFGILIEGLADFLKERDIDFLIAGSGGEKSNLEKIIVKNGLKNNVRLLGGLGHNDLLRFLKASDVFVLNTAYEGFSHQILESMALGTPVVTTNVGGNGELIEDGKQGFLVGLNDIEAFKLKIKIIFEDVTLTSSLVGLAKERASLFNKERLLNSLIAILP